MSNMKDKSAETKQMMDNLQDELDFAVFEQEEMDPEKVREILAKMESIDPEADEVKSEFDKDLVWKRIQEQCKAEMEEEFATEKNIAEFSGAAGNKEKKGAGKSNSGKSKSVKGNSGKIRRIALTAATIVIAVFVGANIGTYATEKKSVIEYVQDLGNGMEIFVSDDVSNMEVKQETEVYYSWNDVPNEYKEFLVIPQGLPEDMGLYDIKVLSKEVVDELIIRYIDADAKNDFTIQITVYQNEEISFANLIYDDDYELLEQRMLKDVNISYYSINETGIVAQFIYGKCLYTFSGTLDSEPIKKIVEKTIESNF